VKQSGNSLPLDIEAFYLAIDLLRAAGPGPQVRAALIEVFAELLVTLVDQTPDGSVALAISYNQPPYLSHRHGSHPLSPTSKRFLERGPCFRETGDTSTARSLGGRCLPGRDHLFEDGNNAVGARLLGGCELRVSDA